MICILAICICPLVSRGQASYTLAFDRYQSEHFGAGNMITAHKALYTFQDAVIPDTLFVENRWYKKTGGFFYRMLRFWLLDAQLDYLTVLTQHEVFGHGARYREMGHIKNSFHINLFFPYGDGSGYARSGELNPGHQSTPQTRISEVFAGNEATQLMSNDLEAAMLLNGTIHYRQASLFLASRNNLPAYIWRTRLLNNTNPFASDDIATYIMDINNIYFREAISRRIEINRLSIECLTSLLDPIQVYSAYAILVSYGIKGKKSLSKIPMIRLGNVGYLPSFQYSLTPFGPQFHMINYVKWEKRLFSAAFSYGIGGRYQSYGVQLASYKCLQLPWIELDAKAELWHQQELQLDHYSYVPLPPKTGGSASVQCYLHPLKNNRNIGLYLQGGYKTKGYMLGENLDHGLILRYGLSGRF